VHNLVPQFIQESYKKGVFRGDFPAASLFFDLSGFSTTTESLMKHGPHGAEVLASMMRLVFEPLASSVHAHGGFIASMAGDAFTALFPQDAAGVHALAAACEARQHFTANARQDTPYGSFIMQAKMGLSSGNVNWGIVSSRDGRRSVYYFHGAAVDGCTKAQHQAEPGEIILDASLYSIVQEWVDCESQGDYYRLKTLTTSQPAAQPYQAPVSDPAVMERFYPPMVVKQTHSGEFRQVVNLFINLPTVRTLAQLTIFMQTLFELLDRYGGLLNKLDFGDKGSNLLLFWGAPVAHENDIQRALDFILSLQPLTSIPINAGITYQIAHAGFIGSPLLEEYTCFGLGVNLAARFMMSAPRGEIWVDEHIARRARGHFEFDFEGEFSFKGFAQPQAVYALRERKEESLSIFTGAMVGREQELRRLADFITPLWQGRYAGALVISGDPGIGKSRLVHEFMTSKLFEEHTALWIICQTDAILREPLNPFRYWLRGYFAISQSVTEARNKRSFNLKLDDVIQATAPKEPALADELDRTRSFLGALVDLHWSDSLYEQLEPQGRYENTLIALTSLLQAESLRQPVILLLEDAHWLDDASREYLPRLERALTAHVSQALPFALLFTARRDSDSWLSDPQMAYQEMTLSGIAENDLFQLVEQILGGQPSEQLIKLLASRTEGNPFFAEQIARYLMEEGRLEQGPQGWQVTQDEEQPPLPVDIRAVVVARLDRLGKEVEEVVQTAAILGREFEVQLLARMLQGDERLFQKLALATEAAIWSALSELRYLFKHALVQDTAYRMLVRSHRRALHAVAVEAMESLYTQDLNLHYGELAYHSEQAELVDRARRYLLLAGDAASDAYQNIQAAGYYSRALNITPETDQASRYQLLLKREAIYSTLGEREKRRADLTSLTALAEALDAETGETGARSAEVWERLADYAIHTGDYPDAASTAEKSVSLARAANSPDVAVKAYISWSIAALRQGSHAIAMRLAGEGLDLARANNDPRSQGLALNMLGLIAMEQKDAATVRRYLEESLHLARESGNRRLEARSLNNLGNLAGGLGDFIEAKANYDQALRIAHETGARAGEGLVLGNLGWVMGTLGDYPSARAYCEQNLRIARESGDRHVEAYVFINLSAFAGRQGDHEGALVYAAQALELARQTDDRSASAWALTYAGHAHLALGQAQVASNEYRAALELRQALEQPNLSAEPLAGLARLALVENNLPAAQESIATILAHLDSGGTLDGTDEPLRVYLTCFRVLQAAGDGRAREILDTAHRQLQERAEKISDLDVRRNFLENVPYHREILNAWEG
jgi:predicted ATPase/class 3 adenylate cyclase